MGVEATILVSVILISVGIAMAGAMLVAMGRQAPGTTLRCVISAVCLLSGAFIFSAIDNDAGLVFFEFNFGLGILTGLGALIALICRTRLSKTLGMISVACFFIFMFLIWLQGHGPNQDDAFYFMLFVTPGLIGIFCNRAPRLQPGHCTTCGYNLTGNVSGKCSECGTATSIANGK